jgi:ketosteroid isomerase-like protein
MTTRAALSSLAALLVLAACAPHRIPGTDVRDTRDNRAVYEVVRSYQQALERRDAPAILALVSPDYFDTGGTAQASTAMDRQKLETSLPADLAKLEGLRVDITVRNITVEQDTAVAELFYENYYRVQTPTGPIPRRDADVHQLHLRRTGGDWKITSGL